MAPNATTRTDPLTSAPWPWVEIVSFSQRLHRRLDAQAAVLSDLQIARDVHHRFRCNRLALLIVKVEEGPDRTGSHIHEHQIGSDAIPIGEMRKVQGK